MRDFETIPADNEVLEMVRECVRRVLNEELHISDKLSSILDDLVHDIWEQLRQAPKMRTNTRGIHLKEGKFVKNILSKNVEIYWRCYYFGNRQLKEQNPIGNKFQYVKNVAQNKYALYFTMVDVMETVDVARFLEGLRHELGHFFFDSNKNFKPDKRIGNLNRFANDLLDQKDLNIYKYYIGTILYASLKTEQEAYYNGAYEYMMRSENRLSMDLTFYETQFYALYTQLKLSVDEMSKIPGQWWLQHPLTMSTMKDLKKNYGISHSRLLQIGRETLRKFQKDFGDLVVKVTKDIKDKYGVTPYFTKRSF